MKIDIGITDLILIICAVSLLLIFLTLVLLLIFLKLYKKFQRENNHNLQALTNKIDIEPNVVVIGGGTGQSIFLRGLKQKTKNISAIVTVADDGGGSGVLREDLGMLPPGDIRNCILALANMEPTMSEVMQYRFKEGNLKGQSFGNLFLAAMNGLYDNFETATYKMGEIFAITGRVMPVTLEDINLVAEFENGCRVKGESEIPKTCSSKKTRIKKISLDKPDVKPLDEAIHAIDNADVIVLGPGSLYTSVIPNLLVNGMYEALINAKAPKVYIANIMTQPGETDGFNVEDHIRAIMNHTGENFIDYVLVNNKSLPADVKEKYDADHAQQVEINLRQRRNLDKLGIKCIDKNLLEVKSGYIRHNAKYLAELVVKIALKHSYGIGYKE